MFMADRLTFDQPRRTADGYLAVRARAARTGVQDYLGFEVDPEGKRFRANDRVAVYRPEEEVFSKDAVASFLLKPITDDHPRDPVTAQNWKDHAKGVAAQALRDGEFLAFDLVIMDADAAEAVDKGKRELSCGYGCDLAIEDGTTADGVAYQAVQRSIRGNHIAIVDRARAGSKCRIGDAALCQPLSNDLLNRLLKDGEPPMSKKIMLDGLQVDLADAAAVEVAIGKLLGQLTDASKAKGELETQIATLTTDKATLDAKVVTLEQQVKDAALSPAKLRDAAKAYAIVCDKAKALGVTVTDAMDEDTIQKAVVTAKIGDAAKDWTDAQISASFATLTAGVKPSDPVRSVFADGLQATDAASLEQKAWDTANDHNAWRKQA